MNKGGARSSGEKKIIISTVFASPASDGMEGLPAGRYTQPLGTVEPRLPSQHRAAQQFFFYTREHAAEMAARVAFRPTVVGAVVGSFSLNLSFSWMAVKRNAKDAEADFFYFFPHDSDGGRTAAARRVSSGGGRRVARGMMWVVGTLSPPPPPWVTRRSSAQKLAGR